MFEKRELMPWERVEKWEGNDGRGYLGIWFSIYVEGGTVLGGVAYDNAAAAEQGNGTDIIPFIGEGQGLPEDGRARKEAIIKAVGELKSQLGLWPK
jgi:hypothetical protein